MHRVHAALQRGLQIIHVPAASGRLLRLRLLGLPAALLVLGNGHVSCLGHLLLLGSVGLRLLADGGAEAHDLVEDHLTHLGDVVDNFKVEVKGRRAGGLVRGIVPDVQVWVFERLLDGDARGWVKGQHAVQQVQGVRVGVGEKPLEGDLGHEGQVAHVFLGAGRANARQGLLVGGAQVVQDLVQLIDVVAALEEGTSTEKLGKDTAHGPDVNYGTVIRLVFRILSRGATESKRTSFGVALETQHDLRRTVPSCRDILGHVASILLGVNRETTGQTKVTNLQLAVCIDKKVTGLQITVQYVSRVDVLQTAEDLIDKGLEVCIGQGLARADDSRQVALHQFCNVVRREVLPLVLRVGDVVPS